MNPGPRERWLSPVAVSFVVRAFVSLGLAAGLAGQWGKGATLRGVVLLFLVYVLLDAVPTLFLSFSLGSRSLVIATAAEIAVGTVLWFAAGFSADSVVAVVGFWAMLTGLLGMLGAGALRPASPERQVFSGAGVFAVLLGTWLGLFPAVGLPALVILLGAYGLASGALFLWLAFRLRQSWEGLGRPRSPRRSGLGRWGASRATPCLD